MTKTALTETEADTVVRELERLRKGGDRVSTSHFANLPDMAQSMNLQGRLDLEGSIEQAWKVARSPDGVPVVARLHPLIEKSAGATLPWRKDMLLEIEIAVRLGKDLPVGAAPYQRSDILEAIDTVHLGAEMVWTVLLEAGKVSFPLYLVDRLGNDGYVLGPELGREFLDASSTPALSIRTGSSSIFDAPARHATGDVLTWLLDYANLAERPETVLKAGALITTGTLCGAIPLNEGGMFDIDMAGAPAFSFSLT
ncbi:2-keto-4-pentenoate hydratase [Neorhizobium huautlense]|uniref:2-keto-4-pentenoate hydratase n=1 Tax=Neorhizobium huautlense TaxID=67774 RepID=A0ABT9PM49_9HYPH|nr:2-keto-4-pentenoate hydratase [Neorhizobium huautlense]MDP9835525.1 2-keto-4-pentenoate hydratase [Neorhizobium huautlense]